MRVTAYGQIRENLASGDGRRRQAGAETSPLTRSAGHAGLMLVGLAACATPAARALCIQPTGALKEYPV